MALEFKDGLFHDMWADYVGRVIPKAAGNAQRYSMQQSFLAGALAYQMGMGAAFANDATVGNSLENLKTLDEEIKQMAIEFMDASARATIEATLGGVAIEAEDDEVVGVHLIEARGLTPDDVLELNEMIQQYISVKTKKADAQH